MTKYLRLVAVGDEIAVILPNDLRQRLGVTVGGTVQADERDNIVELRADAEYERQMAIAHRIMDRDAEALAILAR